MKFSGEDAPRSDNRHLGNAFNNQLDKTTIDSGLISMGALDLDDLWTKFSRMETYMKSLDRKEDRKTIIDLENILTLFKERIQLLQEKETLYKVGLEKHETQGSAGKEVRLYVEPKSPEALNRIYKIDKRIEMVEGHLAFAKHNFEIDHPADDLILEYYLKNMVLENRTN